MMYNDAARLDKAAAMRWLERNRRKWEGYAKKAYRQALRQQYRTMLDEWVKQAKAVGTGAIDVAESLTIPTEPMRKAMEQVYVTVGADFARATVGNIKGAAKNLKDDYYTEFMRAYVYEIVGERITLISNTTRQRFIRQVKAAVDEALKEGLSIEQTAERIAKATQSDVNYRAIRIARTEIVSASNAGSLQGAKSTGLALKKVWLASKRGHTRRSHKEMDGKEAELSGAFEVPMYKGNSYAGMERLKYPGDPDGSPGNTVNCRCTIVYKRLTD